MIAKGPHRLNTIQIYARCLDEVYSVLENNVGKRDRQDKENVRKGAQYAIFVAICEEVSRSIKARNIHCFVAQPDTNSFMISINSLRIGNSEPRQNG
jgi:hypothetical protein